MPEKGDGHNVKKMGIMATLLVSMALVGWRAQPTWIELWRGAASPEPFYIVGRRTMPSHAIGRLYDVLDPGNHAGPDLSNRLPAGTKIYTVRGKNPAKELAVEIDPQDFVRARYVGTQRPW